jgi:hypothetical protein
MDAWLPEYVKDGRGTSMVLARSEMARGIIEGGIARAEISLLPVTVDKVIASQAGVVEQKRTQLAYRLWMAGKKATPLRKRVSPVRPSWLNRHILAAREKVRATSHVAFSVAGSSGKDRMQGYHLKMCAARRRLECLLFPARCRDKAKRAISKLVHALMPR